MQACGNGQPTVVQAILDACTARADMGAEDSLQRTETAEDTTEANVAPAAKQHEATETSDASSVRQRAQTV